MGEMPRFRLGDLLALVVVVGLAAAARVWYVAGATEAGKTAPLHVQEAPARPLFHDAPPRPGAPAAPGAEPRPPQRSERDILVGHLKEDRWFVGPAPLADQEENTAHIAPGYYWVVSLVAEFFDNVDDILLWGQCALGALTAGLYFFFARRVFCSLFVGFLAGLFCAVHPFWIINTAEMTDGVLMTFLAGLCLLTGARGSQEGAPFSSLLFGLSLAALAMVRAAWLPFAVIALAWFLLRCRTLQRGWFAAILAFLGFANGLVPWTVRNVQMFGEPIPIADSAPLHLWIGNSLHATGGPLDEETLRKSLLPDRLKELLAEPNQARRYSQLMRDAVEEIRRDPGSAAARRLWAGLYFVFGEAWFARHVLYLPGNEPGNEFSTMAADTFPSLLQAAMLAMLLLGFLGWRWSHGWRDRSRLLALAVVWVPLPYLLSHADVLSGPRLPLDGILLTLSAFALARCVPGVSAGLAADSTRSLS